MRIKSISDLIVLPVDNERLDALLVPFLPERADATSTGGVSLFGSGVVWEDQPYTLEFKVTTTHPIRRATLCVNDHTELWMRSSWHQMRLGGEEVLRYEFKTEEDPDEFWQLRPFQLTCGFARVVARLEFMEGEESFFVSQDLLSLDEPVRSGQTGQTAEEANVCEMLRMLVRPDSNQAAEWMFSPYGLAHDGEPLSKDDITDWAYGSITTMLQAASDSIDLVHDALESSLDAFPNATGESVALSGDPAIGPHDTYENRLVRALLTSMEDMLLEIVDLLLGLLDQTTELLDKAEELVKAAQALRSRVQSAPALAMFRDRHQHEWDMLMWAQDLTWRVQEAIAAVDDEGMGAVSQVPFDVPARTGVFVTDSTYASLRDAMMVWETFANTPLNRHNVALHAIKPDKLFEYSALHRMLDWLHRNGFCEDKDLDTPILRFSYSLESAYRKYHNEERCANTYHLLRDCDHTRVVVLYQPVLYESRREENGVDLHRLQDETGGLGYVDFWTPDFVIVIHDDEGTRRYVLDAKYCRAELLEEKLRECEGKYVARTSLDCGGEPGRGVSGVMVLAGKVDAPEFRAELASLGNASYVRAIAPFNRHVGWRKLDQFFGTMGIK